VLERAAPALESLGQGWAPPLKLCTKIGERMRLDKLEAFEKFLLKTITTPSLRPWSYTENVGAVKPYISAM